MSKKTIDDVVKKMEEYQKWRNAQKWEIGVIDRGLGHKTYGVCINPDVSEKEKEFCDEIGYIEPMWIPCSDYELAVEIVNSHNERIENAK